MNVFWRELRMYRKSVLLWSAGIVLLLVASMAKFNTLTAGGMDVNQLLDQFPATVQAVFGMKGLDITTIVGYFGILYLYVAVMLAIQAGMTGADIIDKEEQDKTTEFLYVKPRSRARILTAKLCAALVVLVVLNIVTFATSCILAAQYVDLTTVLPELALYNAAYALMQLLFMTVGAALAASSLRPKLAGKLVAMAVGVMYFAYVLVTMQPALDWMGVVSPLVQMNASDIVANGTLDGLWVCIYCVVAAVSIAACYYHYPRRDLTV